jgi:hypothetical protein
MYSHEHKMTIKFCQGMGKLVTGDADTSAYGGETMFQSKVFEWQHT